MFKPEARAERTYSRYHVVFQEVGTGLVMKMFFSNIRDARARAERQQHDMWTVEDSVHIIDTLKR